MGVQDRLRHPHCHQHLDDCDGDIRCGPRRGKSGVRHHHRGYQYRLEQRHAGHGGTTDGDGAGTAVRPVVPIPVRRHYHVGADDLYFHHHLWPYAGSLFSHQRGPHSYGRDAGPGVGRHGPELSQIPVCPGIPGISDYGVRGDLCGAGAEYLRKR